RSPTKTRQAAARRRARSRASSGAAPHTPRPFPIAPAPTREAGRDQTPDPRPRPPRHQPPGDPAFPEIVDASVWSIRDEGPLAGGRKPDIGKPPLLLQPCAAGLVERALMREDALLPARKEHMVELQPLGAMERHQAHHVARIALGRLHHQAD